MCVSHLRLFFFLRLPGLLCAARPPQPIKICARNSTLLSGPSYCARLCVKPAYSVYCPRSRAILWVPMLLPGPLNWPKHKGFTVCVGGIRFQSHTWLKCRREEYQVLGNRRGEMARTVRICPKPGGGCEIRVRVFALSGQMPPTLGSSVKQICDCAYVCAVTSPAESGNTTNQQ